MKLDLIMAAEFTITGLFIWYTILEVGGEGERTRNYLLMIPEIAFFVVLVMGNVYGHFVVKSIKVRE